VELLQLSASRAALTHNSQSARTERPNIMDMPALAYLDRYPRM
jgi:hypothetical protein